MTFEPALREQVKKDEEEFKAAHDGNGSMGSSSNPDGIQFPPSNPSDFNSPSEISEAASRTRIDIGNEKVGGQEGGSSFWQGVSKGVWAKGESGK